MERRLFLKVVGGAAGGYAMGWSNLVPGAAAAVPESTKEVDRVAGLPRRLLGRTGQKLSIVGFPGLALSHTTQEEGTAALHKALDLGVNYYDVAPAYGNGDCEIKMGIGLQGLDRSKYFLACKTKARDKEGARKELERSLERLKTDHFDLYQLHHLRWADEVKQALGPGGAMETILKAKEEGKIKYIGFSAHTTRGALDALKGFKFDTVMFPINFVELMNYGFGQAVLDEAAKQGAGVLAIKPMSMGNWAKDEKRPREWWYRSAEEQKDVDLVMRYALSLPGVVAGIAPSFVDLFEKSVAAAKAWKPVSDTDLTELKFLAAKHGSIFQTDEKQAASLLKPLHPLPDYPPASGLYTPYV